eukprot:CAMPEP_0175025562 /NCGR_PEP_ID=MMETSP0005-20121125/17192_1 /TAXON_ID=420556 /ORGANISM="Ochromonas sp., Strain CCMP1393" /LENGTH=286 /DNA_ID=CAMNT_0016284441 /DNA_START=93 /DNA_END=951 /DNA_ORIENTATION=-
MAKTHSESLERVVESEPSKERAEITARPPKHPMIPTVSVEATHGSQPGNENSDNLATVSTPSRITNGMVNGPLSSFSPGLSPISSQAYLHNSFDDEESSDGSGKATGKDGAVHTETPNELERAETPVKTLPEPTTVVNHGNKTAQKGDVIEDDSPAISASDGISAADTEIKEDGKLNEGDGKEQEEAADGTPITTFWRSQLFPNDSFDDVGSIDSELHVRKGTLIHPDPSVFHATTTSSTAPSGSGAGSVVSPLPMSPEPYYYHHHQQYPPQFADNGMHNNNNNNN